jgi:two-component system chemotaxis response regulator CheY
MLEFERGSQMKTAVSELAGPGPSPARVLIVDDDPAMRLVCSTNLQAAGLNVLEARDGRHGLALARTHRPDLVLTDVTMPRLDGFELAAALRSNEDTRLIPLIFLSGETAGSHQERATALGAFAYVTKPFDPAKLASIVANALAHAGRRKPPGARRRLKRVRPD